MSISIKPSRLSIRRRLILVALAGALTGCATPPEKGVVDDNPSVRIRAIKRAQEQKDLSVVKDLVAQLSDDDPAVRFYAIQGLVRITGKDLGYRYFDPLSQRQQAVDRWKLWLSEKDPANPANPQASQAAGEEVSSW